MRALFFVLPLAVACTEPKVEGETATGATETTGMEADADPTSPGSDATDATTGAEDNPSGFCSPAASNPNACPTNYICCSDDPASTRGRLPNYFTPGTNDDVYGVPIFSANNNALSYSGQCVDVGEFVSPFMSGCPVPCNPTWGQEQKDVICGLGSTCCPFQQIDPVKDCVLDPKTNRWRSVVGTDIGTLSTWGAQHTTNQDPTGVSCNLFASPGGMQPNMEVLKDCYDQLTVADRRGFCYQDCPCYEDLCDQKNPDFTPRCGSGGSSTQGP